MKEEGADVYSTEPGEGDVIGEYLKLKLNK